MRETERTIEARGYKTRYNTREKLGGTYREIEELDHLLMKSTSQSPSFREKNTISPRVSNDYMIIGEVSLARSKYARTIPNKFHFHACIENCGKLFQENMKKKPILLRILFYCGLECIEPRISLIVFFV